MISKFYLSQISLFY